MNLSAFVDLVVKYYFDYQYAFYGLVFVFSAVVLIKIKQKSQDLLLFKHSPLFWMLFIFLLSGSLFITIGLWLIFSKEFFGIIFVAVSAVEFVPFVFIIYRMLVLAPKIRAGEVEIEKEIDYSVNTMVQDDGVTEEDEDDDSLDRFPAENKNMKTIFCELVDTVLLSRNINFKPNTLKSPLGDVKVKDQLL